MRQTTTRKTVPDRPTDGPRSEGKPVDLVHLAAMTQGDGDLEREVLSIFVSQAPVYVAAYRAARDAEGRRRAAHTLKGVARGIGAWRLAEAAELAESVDRLASIEDETGRVCEFIRNLG
jgi:HPt (histidine-containing phosphotransfer) domain-containing protein